MYLTDIGQNIFWPYCKYINSVIMILLSENYLLNNQANFSATPSFAVKSKSMLKGKSFNVTFELYYNLVSFYFTISTVTRLQSVNLRLTSCMLVWRILLRRGELAFRRPPGSLPSTRRSMTSNNGSPRGKSLLGLTNLDRTLSMSRCVEDFIHLPFFFFLFLVIFLFFLKRSFIFLRADSHMA